MSMTFTGTATVSGVKADGANGISVTLNLPGDALEQMAILAECARINARLEYEFEILDQRQGDSTHDSKKGRPYRLSFRNG